MSTMLDVRPGDVFTFLDDDRRTWRRYICLTRDTWAPIGPVEKDGYPGLSQEDTPVEIVGLLTDPISLLEALRGKK